MNKQDAIKCLKSIQQWVPDFDDREDGFSYWDAIDMAIDALDPPNEPLTLDELRKGYNTPVWLSWYGDVQEWAFVRPYSKTHLEVLVFDGEADLVRIDEYRRSWVVYRRPPEGEVNA